MLDLVSAVRFDRRMSSGKSWPCLLVCERSSGEEVEVIAKFSAGFERNVGGLVAEAIAAMLAADLNIPVPEPLLVRVEDDFIELVRQLDAPLATKMANSPRVAFGSLKLPPGFMIHVPDLVLKHERLTQAAEIFAFDALIQNSDRRPDNPNCLSKGHDFAAIDHELAFMTEGVLFWQPPWVTGSLESYKTSNRHLFFSALKGKRVDFSSFQRGWLNISDQRLSEYKSAIPPEWSSANNVALSATNLIREIRDNIIPALAEIRRVLG
jgi:hypothetical protein